MSSAAARAANAQLEYISLSAHWICPNTASGAIQTFAPVALKTARGATRAIVALTVHCHYGQRFNASRPVSVRSYTFDRAVQRGFEHSSSAGRESIRDAAPVTCSLFRVERR